MVKNMFKYVSSSCGNPTPILKYLIYPASKGARKNVDQYQRGMVSLGDRERELMWRRIRPLGGGGQSVIKSH